MSEPPEADDPPAQRTRSPRRKTQTAARSRPPSGPTEPSEPDATSPSLDSSDTADATASVSEEAESLASLAQHVGRMTDDPRLEQRLIASFFSGPIPPPAEMALYKEIMPDLPARIVSYHEWQLRQTDEEARHRRDLQRRSFESKNQLANRGQLFAFAVILANYGVVAYALVTGQSGTAAAFGLPGLALVLLVFFGGAELNKRSGLQQAAVFKDALEQFWPRRTAAKSNDESGD